MGETPISVNNLSIILFTFSARRLCASENGYSLAHSLRALNVNNSGFQIVSFSTFQIHSFTRERSDSGSRASTSLRTSLGW
jgi:hypothetical protein